MDFFIIILSRRTKLKCIKVKKGRWWGTKIIIYIERILWNSTYDILFDCIWLPFLYCLFCFSLMNICSSFTVTHYRFWMKLSIGIDIHKLFATELELNVRDVICKCRISRTPPPSNLYNEIFFKMGKTFYSVLVY